LIQRRLQLQRGSISILSVVWLAFTCVGVSLIAEATNVVHRRALVQESADSIALAAVIGGADVAGQLEQRLKVNITKLNITDDGVVVEVQMGDYIGSSSASRGA
jgi:hypothetical protein